eukprot:GHVT01009618.1.p1 GENE.GHVT01009618.1~~GHVT01009618.1.p1  ORF type:complete len:465 (+),score=106.61 GHVT01009618.1:2867-4261(+)
MTRRKNYRTMGVKPRSQCVVDDTARWSVTCVDPKGKCSVAYLTLSLTKVSPDTPFDTVKWVDFDAWRENFGKGKYPGDVDFMLNSPIMPDTPTWNPNICLFQFRFQPTAGDVGATEVSVQRETKRILLKIRGSQRVKLAHHALPAHCHIPANPVATIHELEDFSYKILMRFDYNTSSFPLESGPRVVIARDFETEALVRQKTLEKLKEEEEWKRIEKEKEKEEKLRQRFIRKYGYDPEDEEAAKRAELENKKKKPKFFGKIFKKKETEESKKAPSSKNADDDNTPEADKNEVQGKPPMDSPGSAASEDSKPALLNVEEKQQPAPAGKTVLRKESKNEGKKDDKKKRRWRKPCKASASDDKKKEASPDTASKKPTKVETKSKVEPAKAPPHTPQDPKQPQVEAQQGKVDSDKAQDKLAAPSAAAPPAAASPPPFPAAVDEFMEEAPPVTSAMSDDFAGIPGGWPF